MGVPGRALVVVVLTVSLIASACGSEEGSDSAERPSVDQNITDDSNASAATDFSQSKGAVVVNTAGTVSTTGRQRVMTAILGPESRPFLGGPDAPVTITFELVDGDEVGEAEGAWLTTNASALGLYVSNVDFPVAGQWEVIVSSQGSEIARTQFGVTERSTVPNLGDPAPPTDSPTGRTDDEIVAISTDQNPDPDLYDLSIAEAIGNGRPTVIAFVTPAFCQTALCGPTLEAVKGAAADHDGIDVVHVEPFDVELATTGELVPVPAMAEWGLVTEPWVFVIDADGRVSASFEGIIGQTELEAAIDRL